MSNIVMKQCKSCKTMTQHTEPSTSHILHLILSIISVGFWVPVWILVSMSNGSSAQCTACGKTKGIFG